MNIPFIKMSGAGNDFVVLDGRKNPVALSGAQVKRLASRDNAVTLGCDQLIVLEPPPARAKADLFMRIYNADGGEVDACGNATRCIGWKIIGERKDARYEPKIATNAGVLSCRQVISPDFPPHYQNATAIVEADMGRPRFVPAEIPVGGKFDKTILGGIAREIGIGHFVDGTCVGMGNPHVVFFVSKLPSIKDLPAFGERIKAVGMFAEHGVNLTIAELGQQAIFAYVFERGAGITASCGTAACATAVAAVELKARKKNVNIQVQQLQRQAQDLFVRWDSRTDQVFLIGPVRQEFERVAEV